MIDTVRLVLREYELNEPISFLEEVGARIKIDKHKSSGHKLVGWLDNMRIEIKERTLWIDGSLSKYANGHNVYGMKYEDIKGAYLVDVRSKAEFSAEPIPGAVNIFTPELRTRYNELPRDKKIILFCNTGFQSYVASRILIQLGFDNVYSLTGGITLYNELKKDKLSSAEQVLMQ